MPIYNLVLIGFIIASFFLALWWAFNRVRRIELQKQFCAMPLTSIAKLWRRANFVPEDAKERESLYLYRDFLRKFDESECKYPIMVKNGGVRCMTRKEYDDLCGQKQLRNFSGLLVIISVLLAVASLVVNLFFTHDILMGVGLAVIMPLVQLALAFFVKRFNKEKNTYRDGIFMALKENSVAFLSITKPFIVVDAYPQKFGKNTKPMYAALGEISDEQVAETRNFIVRQKEAETKVVVRSVDNSAEIEQIETPEPTEYIQVTPPAAEPAPAPKAAAKPAPAKPDAPADPKPAPQPAAPAAETIAIRPMTQEQQIALVKNLITDTVQAEVDREINKAAQAAQTPEPVEPINPLPTQTVPATPTNVEPPAEDDFSLDAIGQALDAEIAKRNKKK